MKHLLYFIVFLAIFSACQDKEKAITTKMVDGNKVTVININSPIDSVQMKLSLLGDHFRTVRLETNDSCLVGNATYLVGKKYIVAFSMANIILFDQDGKYIRTLALQGRGPGEFGYVAGKIMNEAESKLIVSDMGKRAIHCWSLPDGQYSQIPLVDKGTVYTVKILNDTTLQFANMRNSNAKYQLYTQTFSGNILGGILNKSNEDTHRVNTENNLFQAGNQFYYLPHFSDSLYLVESDTLMLKYAFPMTKDQRLKILQVSDKQLFTSTYNITGSETRETTINGQKIASTKLEGYTIYHVIDIPKGQICCFQNLQDDYLGMEQVMGKLNLQENGMIYIGYPASTLVSSISKTLEKTDVEEGIRQRLEQLKSEISEEDNPILVIGETKSLF